MRGDSDFPPLMRVSVEGADWPFELGIKALDGDELRFEFHCRDCGGWEMRLNDERAGDMAMASCAACGLWWGRLAAIKVRMKLIAVERGFKVREG